MAAASPFGPAPITHALLLTVGHPENWYSLNGVVTGLCPVGTGTGLSLHNRSSLGQALHEFLEYAVEFLRLINE